MSDSSDFEDARDADSGPDEALFDALKNAEAALASNSDDEAKKRKSPAKKKSKSPKGKKQSKTNGRKKSTTAAKDDSSAEEDAVVSDEDDKDEANAAENESEKNDKNASEASDQDEKPEPVESDEVSEFKCVYCVSHWSNWILLTCFSLMTTKMWATTAQRRKQHRKRKRQQNEDVDDLQRRQGRQAQGLKSRGNKMTRKMTKSRNRKWVGGWIWLNYKTLLMNPCHIQSIQYFSPMTATTLHRCRKNAKLTRLQRKNQLANVADQAKVQQQRRPQKQQKNRLHAQIPTMMMVILWMVQVDQAKLTMTILRRNMKWVGWDCINS